MARPDLNSIRVPCNTASPKIETSEFFLDEFLSSTLALSAICKRYGFNLEAHSATGIAKFSAHPLPIQQKILDACKSFVLFCNSAEKEGIDLRQNNTKLTWWALKQFNLLPHADLFKHLTNDHIVEIYNEDSIQVYRSFNLFQYLSYSISDIFSHEWWELYTRETDVFGPMKVLTHKLLDGSLSGIVKTDYPDHWVQEVFSPQKLRSVMRHDIFVPLADAAKRNRAFASAFRIVPSDPA